MTVFGTASSNAARHPAPGQSPAELAQHVFVVGADTAFWMATIFLAATLLLVIIAIRPVRRTEDVVLAAAE